MRQLRVVGLGDDHETVILEDPIRHERFAVAGDERLRAAARGDVRRLGQMEIEVTSPLRPRDIQARVRAGESVDDVAAAGGVSAAHVERFAYPVLLERARVAEIARRAHPLLPGDAARTDERTLGEIVAATFAARGQDLDDGRWDASKVEGASWIVTLSWQAGRSDNVARWTFSPGAAGGTVDPRDDPARELLGQEPSGGPRRVDKPEDPEAGDGPAGVHGARRPGRGPRTDPRDGRLRRHRPPQARGVGARLAGARHRTGRPRRPERGAARRGGRPARPTMPPASPPPRAASRAASRCPSPARAGATRPTHPGRSRAGRGRGRHPDHRPRRGQSPRPARPPDRPVLGGRPAGDALAPHLTRPGPDGLRTPPPPGTPARARCRGTSRTPPSARWARAG